MPLTFMQGIATEEGFYVQGSRAQRNNNPGNLDYELWLARKYGAVLETIPHGYSESPRFACFPNADAGWSAMRALLTTDYLGLTVEAAINKWAPASDGNAPASYIATVCKLCEVSPEVILTVALIG